jgi:hypothetical protein
MKCLIVLALVYTVSAFRLSPEVVEREFTRFQREFGRQYNGVDEKQFRLEIFEDNLNRIYEHNLNADNGVHSFRLAVNQFADMTNEEFRRTMNGFRPQFRSEVRRKNSTFVGVDVGLPILSTGEPRVPSLQLRIRDSAAHAGLSAPLPVLKGSTS